VVHFNF